MTGLTLRKFCASDLEQISHFEAFARAPGGPCEISVDGEDMSRVRVVVTLLHGNEPSGLRAVHRFIQQRQVPRTKVVFIVGSITAALTPPLFYYRMLPGKADLNRCFTHPPKDLQGALATAIKNRISDYQPEAVIDIHNTSGSGPAFCVAVNSRPSTIALASFFTHRLIITDISLGSLMEQEFGCPVVTVEAGGSEDNHADELAFTGLESFLHSDSFAEPVQSIELLSHPRRLELRDSIGITYAHEGVEDVELTLRTDIERLNFGVTQPNTAIGWLNIPLEEALQTDRHQHLVDDCFYKHEGELYTKKQLRLFMVTNRADIAASDCLFYFQHDLDE